MKKMFASIEEINKYFIKIQIVDIEIEEFYNLETDDEKLRYLSNQNIRVLEIDSDYEIKNKELLEEGSFYILHINEKNKISTKDDYTVIKCPTKCLNKIIDCNLENDMHEIILELNIKFNETIYKLMEDIVENLMKLDRLKNYFINPSMGKNYWKNWNEKYLRIIERLGNELEEKSSYKEKMDYLLKIRGIGIQRASIILNLNEPLKYVIYSKDLNEYLINSGLIEFDNINVNDTEKYSIYNKYMSKIIKNLYEFKYGLENLKLHNNSDESILDYLNKVNFDIAQNLKISTFM